MSTRETKPSSNDEDYHPASGRRRALPSHEDPFPEEKREFTGFSGTCESMSLSDWIQLVQMNRRDAVIGIERSDGKRALLWCRDGDVIDASCDGTTGEDAVYRALTWEGGEISVAFVPFERERRISLTTPALLLRAADMKDTGAREVEPARTPSAPAPLTPARPSVTPPAPRARTAAFSGPAASASSPASANSPPDGRSAASEAFARPAAATRPESRMTRRAWALGVVLGALALVGTMAARNAKPKDDTPREGLSHKIAIHTQASRPELAVSPQPAASPVQEESPSPRLEKAPARPSRSSGRTWGATATPTPRRVVAAPVSKANLPTVPKSAGRAKPDPATTAERAPRIQIIEERESKIEVIK